MSDQFQEGERFTRTSWFILTVCTVLVLLDIAQILYRFQVPTDGWLYNSETIAGPDGNILIYTTNLAGDASSLQPGDLLTAVAGLPVDGGDLSHNPEAAVRLAGIQPGDQVEYTLLRGDRPLKVTVDLNPLDGGCLVAQFHDTILPGFMVGCVSHVWGWTVYILATAADCGLADFAGLVYRCFMRDTQ